MVAEYQEGSGLGHGKVCVACYALACRSVLETGILRLVASCIGSLGSKYFIVHYMASPSSSEVYCHKF